MPRMDHISGRTACARLFLIPGLLAGILLINTCKSFEPEQLVLVETGQVSDVTYHSCQVSGEIYDAGRNGIEQHGFVWSPEEDPVIENALKSELGPKDHTGAFTGSISGLSSATTYYMKAYGTSGTETTYGKQISFTTAAPVVPVVTTAQVTGITDTSAVSGGEVVQEGGSEIMARGVCWDTVPNPTIDDSLTLNGSGTGTFISEVGNLRFNTTYYLRAYATNAAGTGYGEEREFTTGQRQPVIPAVSTVDITHITDTSAFGGGIVTDDGGDSGYSQGRLLGYHLKSHCGRQPHNGWIGNRFLFQRSPSFGI